MVPTYAGVVGAPVTPFKSDNTVDFATFEKQIEFLIQSGVRVLAHPMHIGESVSLTGEERKELARALVSAAGGRVPTFVHVSYAGTDLSAALATHAAKVGATGAVLMPPYHWKSPTKAVLEHYGAVGDASGKMIVYNNPKATNIELQPDVLEQIFDRVPGVVAIKDATFHMETFTDICMKVAATSRDIAVYTGIEHLLTSIPVGGSGCFSACSEVAPRLVQQLYDACMRSENLKARDIQYRVRRLLKVMMHNYPATIKYAMELVGRPVGVTRKPILPPTPEEKAWVKKELTELGIFESETQGWTVAKKTVAVA